MNRTTTPAESDSHLTSAPGRNQGSTIRSSVATLVFSVLGLLVLYGCVATVNVPSDPAPTCTVSPTEFAGWFESGAVTLNGVVKPANSVTFPDQPNCSFYQWSEQMYLWLTSPAPPSYGGGGRILDSPEFFDVSPPDANGQRTFIPHTPGLIRNFLLRDAQVGPNRLPIVFDREGTMFEVVQPIIAPSGRQLILNATGERVEIETATRLDDGTVRFFDPSGKEIERPRPIIRPELTELRVVQRFIVGDLSIFLRLNGTPVDVEQGQAGGGDVLMAQNGSLVFYIATVNNVYAYFLTGTKNGGIVPAPTQFPTSQPQLDKVLAFASANGKTLIDPEALAIEIKTSWVEAVSLPDPSSFITVTATIPTYDTSDPNEWVPNGQKTTKLALVGIHVVGSTKGHPEMIWATFEHVRSTPNDTYSYVNSSNQTVQVPRDTQGDWMFAANNATDPFNQVHMRVDSQTGNIVSISPFTISPSNTIRRKAWGAATDAKPNPIVASAAASNTEIISTNNSVRGQLANGDVRGNYIMTGATWTIGGAAPNGSSPNGNEVGTSKLANTTMETYQQGANTLFATGTNCFGCHHDNTTSVSHIFGPLQPLF